MCSFRFQATELTILHFACKGVVPSPGTKGTSEPDRQGKLGALLLRSPLKPSAVWQLSLWPLLLLCPPSVPIRVLLPSEWKVKVLLPSTLPPGVSSVMSATGAVDNLIA